MSRSWRARATHAFRYPPVDSETHAARNLPTVVGDPSHRPRRFTVSGIRVTPEQLQSLSGRVSNGAGSIDSELRSLAASLAPLGGDWAGVAQARFQALWADWQRNAHGLNEALTGISQLL